MPIAYLWQRVFCSGLPTSWQGVFQRCMDHVVVFIMFFHWGPKNRRMALWSRARGWGKAHLLRTTAELAEDCIGRAGQGETVGGPKTCSSQHTMQRIACPSRITRLGHENKGLLVLGRTEACASIMPLV